MKITIIGTGYVGLVTGACFAELGNEVFCIDIDARKIELLNNGGLPVYEPGLKALIARNLQAGRIRFSTDLAASVAHGAVQFIAVGTPPDEDGSADLNHVLAAARAIGRYMSRYTLLSTNRRRQSALRSAFGKASPRNWPRAAMMRRLQSSQIPNFCRKARRLRILCGRIALCLGAHPARKASARAQSCSVYMRPLTGIMTACYIWTCVPPSSRNTQRTRCWRRAFPL